MARSMALTDRMRRFIAEYRGEGDGKRAAKAAGYAGGDKAISVQVARLLKHGVVREAVAAKLNAEAAKRAAARAAAGPSIGSTTRRLELLMAIAEDPDAERLDRIRAISKAAEIAGEIGRGRLDPLDPQAAIPDAPPAPEPGADLVLNDRGPSSGRDAGGGNDDEGRDD